MTDLEYLERLNKIEIYAEILLGILRYVPVKNTSPNEVYYEELRKKLKFENLHDSDLFRACIDLLEDSQNAIEEFYENGLFTKSKSTGEMYLRLYGVLNACYLQMNSIFDLIRIFKIRNEKEIKSKFKNLKLIEIRNKLGSHTTNYKVSDKEIDFFRLSQSTLSEWGNCIRIVSSKDSEEIDLLENIKEFTFEIEKTLDEICGKAIGSIF